MESESVAITIENRDLRGPGLITQYLSKKY